jgi:hypothetical protein
MKDANLNCSTTRDPAVPKACHLPPFLQLIRLRSRRKISIAKPAAPRRPCSAIAQKILSLEREIEMAEWQASGGDYLAETRQAVR